MRTAVEHRNTSLPATGGPLFVLSVWRSGSSLLYTLLNQHSQIGLLYEGDLPRLHRFLWGRFQNGSWRERWEFWNQGPSRHGIALEAMPANVRDAWEATRVVYQEVARRKQAIIWGEKTPHWYDYPVQMAKQFPDARFIFLWRDTHAVLRSVARAAPTERFFRKAGFPQRILIGTENLRRACDAFKSQGRPVYEVTYEDLTANTSECMQQICHFLQIPFEERMTSLEGADRSAIASGEHHIMVRSGRILGPRTRTEVLPSALRAKINRYVCRWKQGYDGAWPKYPRVLPPGTRPPSLFERWRDRLFYQALLGKDMLIAVTYGVVPMDAARGLRSWVRQRGHNNGLLPMSQ
jgi:hypothetical protein